LHYFTALKEVTLDLDSLNRRLVGFEETINTILAVPPSLTHLSLYVSSEWMGEQWIADLREILETKKSLTPMLVKVSVEYKLHVDDDKEVLDLVCKRLVNEGAMMGIKLHIRDCSEDKGQRK